MIWLHYYIICKSGERWSSNSGVYEGQSNQIKFILLKKVTFKNCKQPNQSMSRASKAQKSTYSDPKVNYTPSFLSLK